MFCHADNDVFGISHCHAVPPHRLLQDDRLRCTLQEAGKQRFQVQDLAPVLEPLLSALFSAFTKPDSAENEYVMRCIMRVIDFVGPEVSIIV